MQVRVSSPDLEWLEARVKSILSRAPQEETEESK